MPASVLLHSRNPSSIKLPSKIQPVWLFHHSPELPSSPKEGKSISLLKTQHLSPGRLERQSKIYFLDYAYLSLITIRCKILVLVAPRSCPSCQPLRVRVGVRPSLSSLTAPSIKVLKFPNLENRYPYPLFRPDQTACVASTSVCILNLNLISALPHPSDAPFPPDTRTYREPHQSTPLPQASRRLSQRLISPEQPPLHHSTADSVFFLLAKRLFYLTRMAQPTRMNPKSAREEGNQCTFVYASHHITSLSHGPSPSFFISLEILPPEKIRHPAKVGDFPVSARDFSNFLLVSSEGRISLFI
jgi:hypothetical protein